jgi:YfiR/HmsC-like
MWTLSRLVVAWSHNQARSPRRRRCCALVLLGLLLAWLTPVEADPDEYQVKAVFLYNFSHFVAWPTREPATPIRPFTICVLGADPFERNLDEAVRGEHVAERSLLVRRIREPAEAVDCEILFIARSEGNDLDKVLTAVAHRTVLTVSELDGAAQRGVMIQFVNENNKIRLRINDDSARAAGLIVSSKLLRLADIVPSSRG